KGTAVRKAAKLYGVLLTTLRDRVDNRVSADIVKSGQDKVLSELKEARLIQHIDYMSDLGYGYGRTQVMELASDLSVHLHKRERSRPLGRMRCSGFKSRWPQIKKRPESIYNIGEKGIINEQNPPYVVASCTVTPQAVTSPSGKITTIL
ncbi:hypothetical protein KUTeg_004970, partial [Tegillarca granosa]